MLPSVFAKKMCATCIFGNKSPITQESFDAYQTEWESDTKWQECHTHTIKQERVACRGHFNAWERGELPYPLEEAFDRLYPALSHLHPEQKANMLTLFGFIDHVTGE